MAHQGTVAERSDSHESGSAVAEKFVPSPALVRLVTDIFGKAVLEGIGEDWPEISAAVQTIVGSFGLMRKKTIAAYYGLEDSPVTDFEVMAAKLRRSGRSLRNDMAVVRPMIKASLQRRFPVLS